MREKTAAWPRALVLCLAVGVCYANSLRVPFLLDDPRPGVQVEYSTRHITWGSFDLNRALGGEATWSYHLFNALVHLLAGLLLFGVLRRSMAHVAPNLAPKTRGELAFVTALLWLCHPLQTAAVTYLSQRAEVLVAFFYLGVLYAFLRSLSAARPWVWQTLALLSLALGFDTKEIITTAPLVVVLFDALFLARGPLAALRLRPGFYSALALVTLGLALVLVVPTLFSASQTAGLRFEQFGPLEYARTQAGVLLHYLRLVFWPHPLCFDYGWPIARTTRDWLPQMAVIAALLATTVVLCARRSWIGFAGACFFLILAPTSSFVPILDPAFEHRMYLPLAAVLTLAVVGGWRLVTRFQESGTRALPILAGAVTLALAALTIRRNQDYRSAVGLWQRTVAQAPHHARARGSLGAALLEAGRAQEAIPELFEALRLDTRDGSVSLAVSPVVYLKLGQAYAQLEQPERALPFFQRAVELSEWPESLQALGTALLGQGDYPGAVLQFEKALALEPNDAVLHTKLAAGLTRSGRVDEALRHLEEALRLAPEREEARLGMSALLAAQAKPSEALEHARKALEIAPNTAGEHFELGQLLDTLARFDEAMAAFREAMRLAPELPAPCAAFARTVCRKPDATPEERQEALRLALKAREMTSARNAGFLEVCALAHAAVGDFARAAVLLEEALELPESKEDPFFASQLRAQREDYLRRAGQ